MAWAGRLRRDEVDPRQAARSSGTVPATTFPSGVGDVHDAVAAVVLEEDVALVLEPGDARWGTPVGVESRVAVPPAT